MPPRGYPCRLGASGAQALVSACAHRLARTVFPGIGGHRAHHSPRRWHRGLALGLAGAALVELGTERGSAQRDGAGGAAIASANDRASAAINGYKNLNNRLGKFVNEPGDLIGKDSGPIPQDRGVGGGLPTNVIADGAITQPKLSPELQARLDVAGPAGPQGPPGPPGPPGNAASINGIPAGGDLIGTYPNPTLASRAVGPEQLDTPAIGRFRGTRFVELLNRRTTVLSLEPPDNGPRTFQTASFFDPASPRQITVPFDGFYDIGAKINFAGDPDGVGIRRVSVNRIRGGQTTRYSLARFAPPSTARSVSVIDGGEAIIPAEAGDRFQVAGHQSSGGKLNAVVSSFEITYLGPPQSALVAPPQGPIATGP